MKVLVAIDATHSSDAIVNEMVSRLWPAETFVRLLYVKNPLSLSSDFVDVESYFEQEDKTATDFVEQTAKALASAGLQVNTVISKGNPSKTIVSEAKQWDADLIIIGAQGSGKLSRFFLGSVAKDVVRTATCSVEVVRAKASSSTSGFV
jgi:nucleotide-binding universal stress UspA family protein